MRREKPKAKVKYHIRARLNTRIADLMGMSYKQILVIRERPPNFEVAIQKASLHQIKTWCCCDQGTSSITVQFDKNTFLPSEIAHATVILDNSNCKIALNNVTLSVE